MAAGNFTGFELSGNYHYMHDSKSFQYVKKTGYLVMPPEGRLGRWRKRWCMLVDLVKPEDLTGTPARQIRLEYYPKNPRALNSKDTEVPKIKGVIDLRSCVAVVPHDQKIKGHSHVFNIIMKSNLMVHHLVAHSEQERREWVTALNDFIFSIPVHLQNYFTENKQLDESTYLSDTIYDDSQVLENCDGGTASEPAARRDQVADRSSLTLSVSSGYIKIEEVECGGDFSLDSDQMLRTGYCDVASSREYLPIRSRDKRCRINRPTEPEDEWNFEESYYNFYTPECRATSKPASNLSQRVPTKSEFYDSATVYWNDPFPYVQDQQKEAPITRGSLSPSKRSESTGDLCRTNTGVYDVKLPLVDRSTLNTRWSFSSTEAVEEDFDPQINIHKPNLSGSDPSAENQPRNPYASADSSSQSSSREDVNIHSVQRTHTSPARKSSDPLQNSSSPQATTGLHNDLLYPSGVGRNFNTWNGKHSSETYYNVAAILAHLNPLGACSQHGKPSSDKLASSSDFESPVSDSASVKKLNHPKRGSTVSKEKQVSSFKQKKVHNVDTSYYSFSGPDGSKMKAATGNSSQAAGEVHSDLVSTSSMQNKPESSDHNYCNLPKESPDSRREKPDHSYCNLPEEFPDSRREKPDHGYCNLPKESRQEKLESSNHDYHNLPRESPDSRQPRSVNHTYHNLPIESQPILKNQKGDTAPARTVMKQNSSPEACATTSRSKAPAVIPRRHWYNEKGELQSTPPSSPGTAARAVRAKLEKVKTTPSLQAQRTYNETAAYDNEEKSRLSSSGSEARGTQQFQEYRSSDEESNLDTWQASRKQLTKVASVPLLTAEQHSKPAVAPKPRKINGTSSCLKLMPSPANRHKTRLNSENNPANQEVDSSNRLRIVPKPPSKPLPPPKHKKPSVQVFTASARPDIAGRIKMKHSPLNLEETNEYEESRSNWLTR